MNKENVLEVIADVFDWVEDSYGEVSEFWKFATDNSEESYNKVKEQFWEILKNGEIH